MRNTPPSCLFGEVLLCHQPTQAGLATRPAKTFTDDLLSGKTFGLLFADTRSPLTPTLAKAYMILKATRPDFEIVWVHAAGDCSELDRAEFYSAYSEMPWHALPFSLHEVGAILRRKFKVGTSSSLVLVDARLHLITRDGVALVTRDPTGDSWLPKLHKVTPARSTAGIAGLQALLGSRMLLSKYGQVELSEVVGDAPLIAFYFGLKESAHCRTFTRTLARFTKRLEKEAIHLPVVYCSADSSLASFRTSFATMPWHAFCYDDERIDALAHRFRLSRVPQLVVLDTQGHVVINGADEDVTSCGPQVYAEWLSMAKMKRELDRVQRRHASVVNEQAQGGTVAPAA